MTTSRPSRLADWLLRRFASGPKRQSLIGDLHEQYASMVVPCLGVLFGGLSGAEAHDSSTTE